MKKTSKTKTKTKAETKNKSVYNTKLNKILLVCVVLGLISVYVLPWLYYTLPNVGVLSCDEPGAGANCGDADFGGVIFWIYGIPLTIIGAAALSASLLLGYFRTKISDNWGLLKFIVLTIVLSTLFFMLLGFYFDHDEDIQGNTGNGIAFYTVP